jgi:hypothetical protein
MILIQDRFSKNAVQLRKEFDRLYHDPRKAESKRFSWDWWHVPGQYTLLRTPAYAFFSSALWKKLEQEILEFGQRQLGCTAITPPWMSCYIEGCRQEFHADVPHGPFAYVFSLSPWRRRKFTGGETQVLAPEVLDWWSNFQTIGGLEKEHFIQTVSADFNRMIVFDPRVPHGVSEVRGTHDPREGRLVIHGWFTEPKPYFEGTLPARTSARVLDAFVGDLGTALQSFPPIHGTLVVRLEVNSRGQVLRVKRLVDTLISLERTAEAQDQVKGFAGQIARALRSIDFPRSKSGGKITLPLLFR